MNLSSCGATPDAHCCHIRGKVCDYFDAPNVECTLRRELGSWERVYTDPRYTPIHDYLVAEGIPVDCGDWPPPGRTCGTCGLEG